MAAATQATSGHSDLVDLDFVRDAVYPVEGRNVVGRRVTLELVCDVAFQRDPTVLDFDIDCVSGDVGVPNQSLERDAADLVVLAAIRAAGLP